LVCDATGQNWGSGTLVELGGEPEGTAYVLTAWHLFSEWDRRTPPVFFAQQGRDWHGYEGKLLATDPEADLALVWIARPPVRGLRVNVARPIVGAALRIVGWGAGTVRCVAGRLRQFLGTGRGGPFDLIEIGGAPARDGDSGGAILDESGRLAGVISATDGRAAVGACGDRIRAFLDRALGRRIGSVAPDNRQPATGNRQPATGNQNAQDRAGEQAPLPQASPAQNFTPPVVPGQALNVWPGTLTRPLSTGPWASLTQRSLGVICQVFLRV